MRVKQIFFIMPAVLLLICGCVIGPKQAAWWQIRRGYYNKEYNQDHHVLYNENELLSLNLNAGCWNKKLKISGDLLIKNNGNEGDFKVQCYYKKTADSFFMNSESKHIKHNETADFKFDECLFTATRNKLILLIYPEPTAPGNSDLTIVKSSYIKLKPANISN